MNNISIESIDSDKIKIVSYDIKDNSEVCKFYLEDDKVKVYKNPDVNFYNVVVEFNSLKYAAFLKSYKKVFEYLDQDDYMNEHLLLTAEKSQLFENCVLDGEVFDKIDFIYILRERILKI